MALYKLMGDKQLKILNIFSLPDFFLLKYSFPKINEGRFSMMKSILEVKEGLRADLIRVVSSACLPFMLYYLYLDMQYRDVTLDHPLSYGDYLLSHTSDFIVIAFTVFVSSAAILFGPILARKRVGFRFAQHINKLTGTLTRTEEDTTLYISVIQRYKAISKGISNTMEYMEQYGDSLSPEVRQDVMVATKEIAEELSRGLCSTLQKETLNVRKMLEQTQAHFTDCIQDHNIEVKVTCPEDLTVVADPLFARLIFLNIFGLPICSTQSNGEISVVVSSKEGYAHVEVQDSRYVLTTEGKQQLNFPREFLAKNDELKQLCFQNEWGYEFKEQKKGQFYTKISIPLKNYKGIGDNRASPISLH
jgi:hypothetical protein